MNETSVHICHLTKRDCDHVWKDYDPIKDLGFSEDFAGGSIKIVTLCEKCKTDFTAYAFMDCP